MRTKVSEINKRKKDHIKIALSDKSQKGSTGFERYRFVHNALPEINFDEIDIGTNFLGTNLNFPLLISCMTGGVEKGLELNKRLAKAAQNCKIAIGVGSQRIAIKHKEYAPLFDIRKYASDVPIISNIGLVQLNYGFGIKEVKECIKMVDANAIAFHINPIQEVIQPEGDRNFSGLLSKLERIIEKIDTPVIVKEVGFGLSEDVIGRFYKIGVRIFDTAGWGGTNWAYIEGKRRSGYGDLGELFSNWGVATTDSITLAKKVKDEYKDRKMVIIGSGGIRNGLEVAKAVSLGSDLVGMAYPFLKAANIGQAEVESLVKKLGYELRVAMLGVGVLNIGYLQKEKMLKDDGDISLRT